MTPTRDQLAGILTGIPGFSADNVTYYAFPEAKAPGLPFLVYFYGAETPLNADGVNFWTVTHIYVEFYSKLRDMATELAIEQAFTTNGIAFTKDSQYLDDEQDYVTVYEFDLPNE